MPNDTNREKTAGRKIKYKKLLDQGGIIGEKAESTSVDQTLEQILELVQKTNAINASSEIQNHVENAGEVLIDAQVIKMSYELMGSAIKRFDELEFSDQEYFNVLQNTIGSVQNWSKIEDIAMSISHSSKWSQSLFGTFENEPIVKDQNKRERQQRKKNELSQQVKPEVVDKLQKEEKKTQKLITIMKHINQYYDEYREPIPYYQLIIDPDDLMNTVDNAFQVAFLYRDGTICIQVDTEGMPAVRPVSQREKSIATEETYQCVSSLNSKTWKEMIRKYNIQEPMLRFDEDA